MTEKPVRMDGMTRRAFLGALACAFGMTSCGIFVPREGPSGPSSAPEDGEASSPDPIEPPASPELASYDLTRPESIVTEWGFRLDFMASARGMGIESSSSDSYMTWINSDRTVEYDAGHSIDLESIVISIERYNQLQPSTSSGLSAEEDWLQRHEDMSENGWELLSLGSYDFQGQTMHLYEHRNQAARSIRTFYGVLEIPYTLLEISAKALASDYEFLLSHVDVSLLTDFLDTCSFDAPWD